MILIHNLVVSDRFRVAPLLGRGVVYPNHPPVERSAVLRALRDHQTKHVMHSKNTARFGCFFSEGGEVIQCCIDSLTIPTTGLQGYNRGNTKTSSSIGLDQIGRTDDVLTLRSTLRIKLQAAELYRLQY